MLEQFTYAASHYLYETLRKLISFGTLPTSHFNDTLDDEGKYLLARMQDTTLR